MKRLAVALMALAFTLTGCAQGTTGDTPAADPSGPPPPGPSTAGPAASGAGPSAETVTDAGLDPAQSDALMQALITHHQQGVELTAMALDPRHEAAPDVRGAAATARDQLAEELKAMERLNQPTAPDTETATSTEATDPGQALAAPEDDLENLDELEHSDVAPPAVTDSPDGEASDDPGLAAREATPSAPESEAPTSATPAPAPLPALVAPGTMENLAAAQGTQFDKAWLSVMVSHQNSAATAARELRGSAPDSAMGELAGQIAEAAARREKTLRDLLSAHPDGTEAPAETSGPQAGEPAR